MLLNTQTQIAPSKSSSTKPWRDDVYLFPTTIAQQGFWFLDQSDPGNPAYNIAVRFRLSGPLDRESFQRAVDAMIGRHEILRTRIVESDGAPAQVVASHLHLPVGFQDISGLPSDQRAPHSDLLASREASARFDLEKGPLLRVNLLRLGENEHILLVTIHHIIADGWSIGIIAEELGALYRAEIEAEESSLEPLPLQYGDFAVWQRAWLESRDFQKHLRYWEEKLAKLPILEIPTDHPRPPLQTSNGYIESILLPRSLTDRLDSISRREEATLYMVTLAALKILLKAETHSNDVYVGTVVAGRSRVEIEHLIGAFINPLVLRTKIDDSWSFLNAVASVKKTVLDGFEHGDLPFERLVKAIQPKRDLSRHAVFQINFIFQRDFVKPFESAGLSLTAIPSKSPGAIYDLNFFLVEREEGWRSSCEYNTDLYDAETIQRLLRRYKAILEAIANDPTTSIAELARVEEATRQTLAVSEPNPANSSLMAPGALDSIETNLHEIWSRLIGTEPIGLDDDFFDVGGHSLLALKILGKIEETFGQRLTLASFLHKPTIRALASRLRESRTQSRRDQVITLRSVGNKVPMVLVDTGPYYRPLIRRLGENQPVLGLILPDLQSLPKTFRVADIAANLIEALRDVQPRGPYCLSGWCHAGIIAFEMAHQLIAAGDEVSAVILFDADNPTYARRFKSFRATPIKLFFFFEKIVFHLSRLRKHDPKEMGRYIKARIETVLQQLGRRVLSLFYRSAVPGNYEHLKTASWFLFLAVEEYEPRSLDVPVLLFRSHDLQTGWFRDPSLGWGDVLSNNLILHEMPGNHAAMLDEPGVVQLAEKMAEVIPKA